MGRSGYLLIGVSPGAYGPAYAVPFLGCGVVEVGGADFWAPEAVVWAPSRAPPPTCVPRPHRHFAAVRSHSPAHRDLYWTPTSSRGQLGSSSHRAGTKCSQLSPDNESGHRHAPSSLLQAPPPHPVSSHGFLGGSGTSVTRSSLMFLVAPSVDSEGTASSASLELPGTRVSPGARSLSVARTARVHSAYPSTSTVGLGSTTTVAVVVKDMH